MPLLDELSGFEFEDTMEIVFEKMGYRNVRQSRKTADEGRDIIMEESNPNGPPTAVIVECKHTESVGRPVVQKLDSAVKTYEHTGPKRGMIATTGRFSQPAREYAERVGIDLMDGHDIREVADEIGMDLYNGRIEIICERMLNPYHPDGMDAPYREAFKNVRNIDPETVPDPRTTITLLPMVSARTNTERTFETGAGVIHEVNSTDLRLVNASRDGPELVGEPFKTIVFDHGDDRVGVDAASLDEFFDTVQERRFGMTETEYRDWLAEKEVNRHTRTVQYTGDNNVTYTKECIPSTGDVDLQTFTPLYVPRIYASARQNNYSYRVDWIAAGDHVEILENDVESCVHCNAGETPWELTVSSIVSAVKENVAGPVYTYCEGCGAVACRQHTKTDAVTGEPVCTACGDSARFAGAKKYFASEETREAYEEKYEDLAAYEKLAANVPAVVVTILFTFLLFTLLFVV